MMEFDSMIRKIMEASRANMEVTAGIERMRVEIQKMEMEARLAMAQIEAQLVAGALSGITIATVPAMVIPHPVRKITADIKRLSDEGFTPEQIAEML